jgi:peroxiredoxin
MKKLVLAAFLCLLSTHVIAAEEKKLAAEVKPSVSIIEYPKFRVGDIAPSWSLLDTNKKFIDSQKFIGSSAQAWVFNLSEQSNAEFKFYSVYAPTLKHIEEANKRIKENATKTIPSGNGRLIYGYSEFLFPNSSGHKLQKQINLKHSVIIMIDRAGFIRSLQTYDETPIDNTFIDLTPKLEVGEVAPDFSIPDMNGTVRRVSDLRGRKNLLLTFFPKCFTGGCINHLSSIQKEYLSYIATDTEVWAVSIDPAEGAKGQIEFAKRWSLQFPLIPDEGRNVSILYGAAQNPNQLASRMSVLIDKNGIVRLIDKQVDIQTHGADIILQMRRLGMMDTPARQNQTPDKTP